MLRRVTMRQNIRYSDAASWVRSIDPVRLGDALAFLAASLFWVGVVGVVLSTVY